LLEIILTLKLFHFLSFSESQVQLIEKHSGLAFWLFIHVSQLHIRPGVINQSRISYSQLCYPLFVVFDQRPAYFLWMEEMFILMKIIVVVRFWALIPLAYE